ncbi:unnamed protein product [Peronospora farinosa]|uniref:RRM domain-containing protein n=1 Tax=Peronospora farinosa TaxID=134698 RepID=A0AAV0TXJ8_9STRA|nr:unnamed protein product [Peronospora farinosa]CAI5729262.1 unnamed protein product [Peronospora farinosa]
MNLEPFVQAAIQAKPSVNFSKTSRRRRKKRLHSVPGLSPTIPPAPVIPTSSKPRSKRKSKLKSSSLQCQVVPKCKFRVQDLVTVDEWNDEQEVEDIQSKLRAEFSRFGQLQSIAMIREEDDRNGFAIGDVVVTFCHANDAASAFSSYNGVLIGEKKVMCQWKMQSDDEKRENMTVRICGILMLEELQDPDELVEVNEEMMQLFCKYGQVETMFISETTGDITVTFVDEQVAKKAMHLMNGSRYGGRLLTASLVLQKKEEAENIQCVNDPPHVVETNCVAAPITQSTESLELQNLVGGFLKRLAALQDRAHTQNPRHDKRSRRLVLGLHEVRRGLLRRKLVLLVMATDLDGCKAVKEQCAELVSVATEQEVPILTPMNRRKLGRSLQKSVRVSCVGVYSIEGANDLFQQILQKVSQ